MKVHNTLGNGFQEMIYQRCLAIELDREGVQYVREQEHPIYYQGIEVGSRRADFVVEGTVMVELKAVIELQAVHLAQAKNYLTAYDLPIGLLINLVLIASSSKKYLDHRATINPENPLIQQIMILTM